MTPRKRVTTRDTPSLRRAKAASPKLGPSILAGLAISSKACSKGRDGADAQGTNGKPWPVCMSCHHAGC